MSSILARRIRNERLVASERPTCSCSRRVFITSCCTCDHKLVAGYPRDVICSEVIIIYHISSRVAETRDPVFEIL